MAHTRPIPTTIALLVGTFLSSMDVTVVGTALPRITGQLGGLALYPYVFSVYLITSTASVPVWGWLLDRAGRKPSYLWGVSLFLAGSLACGAAPTMGWLVVARGLQGLGAGAIVPVTQTVFGDIFPIETRARMQGVFAFVWAVSSIIGPAVGGLIVQWWTWPWVFYVNLPVGATAMALFAVNFHEPPRTHAHGPALPFDLLSDHAVAIAVGTGLLTGPILYAFIAYVPLFLQGALGIEPVWAGLATAPVAVAWSAATFIGGRWLLRSGIRVVLLAGTVILVAGAAGFWLALALLPSASGLFVFFAANLFFGAGMGMNFSLLLVAVQERVPWERRGALTALITLSRQIGATLGLSALGAYVALSLAHRLASVPNAPAPHDLLDPHRLSQLAPGVLAPARAALGASIVTVFGIVTALAILNALWTTRFPAISTATPTSPRAR